MNRLRLTGTFPATARSALAMLVDAVQRAPGSISLVLVVDALRKAARPVQRAADGATITETDK